MIYPKPLKAKDKVALISPGRFVPEESVEAAALRIKSLGYEPIIFEQNFMRHFAFAGTDEQRLNALHTAFKDPEIKAIWCMRGAYGSQRLVEGLDFDLIKKNPKIFIGSSDITALLSAIYCKTGLIGFHGPVQITFDQHPTELAEEALKNTLSDPYRNIELEEAVVLQKGEKVAKGKLIGGNLHLIQALIGTPFEPDWQDALLFIEDTQEQMYALERICYQLKQHGVFDKISALLVGKTYDLKTYPQGFDLNEEDLFGQFVKQRNIPYVFNVPCGHDGRITTFPFGVEAQLNLEGSPKIELQL